jgi:hypothetical protein
VQGRVILCGDAAHQFPPTGGLGVNTGLQGMHNVMWKLAYFVQDRAPWTLVETYDTERRELAKRITMQSLQNSSNVGKINAAATKGVDSGLSTEEVVAASRRYGNHLGIELGAAYVSPAVVPDGTTPPAVEDDYSDYAPSATPGCRAPHVWLGDREAQLSTLDLFAGFTLLAAPGGEDWLRAAKRVDDELDVRIDAYRVGTAGLRDDGTFARTYGLANDGAVLVRPDGHVGWRCAKGPADATAPREALRSILGR